MSIRCSVRLLASATLLVPSLHAQLRWEVLATSPSPAPRFGHAIASYGFLFGGRDGTQAFGDTWELQTWGWRQVVTANAPSPRHGHAITQVIDAFITNQKYLLFGGEDFAGAKDGSTWRFTGHHQSVPGGVPVLVGNWEQLLPAVAPSPRSGHAMAADWWTGTKCLLFGGVTADGPSDQTWLFEHDAWRLIPTDVRPSARTGHQLLPVDAGWILCGGTDGESHFEDCWFFDGKAWHVRPAAPFTGTETLAAWTPRGRYAVLSSEAGGPASLHERTWNGTWLTQEQTGAVPARTGAAVFSWAPLLLFGGRDAQGNVLGDTLRLVPEHSPSIDLVGTGCGPGAWGNNGPDLFPPWQLLLGGAGITRIYTATPGVLTVLGVQLGAAPPPTCEITVVPELLVAGVTGPTAFAEVELAVPFVPALRGIQLSMQALAFEPQASTGLAISKLAILTVGD